MALIIINHHKTLFKLVKNAKKEMINQNLNRFVEHWHWVL